MLNRVHPSLPLVTTNQRQGLLMSLSHIDDPSFQLLEEAASKYQTALPEIERYYYRKTREVKEAEVLATSEQDLKRVLEAKAFLLSQFEELKELESGSPGGLRASLRIFVFNLVLSIALGVLLNTNTLWTSLIGSILFITYFASSIVTACSQIYKAVSLTSGDVFIRLAEKGSPQQPSSADDAQHVHPTAAGSTASTISTASVTSPRGERAPEREEMRREASCYSRRRDSANDYRVR